MLRNPADSLKPPWANVASMVASVVLSLMILLAVMAVARRSRPSPNRLDFDLPKVTLPDLRPAAEPQSPQLWIYVRVGKDARDAPRPQYIVQDQPVRDKADLKAALSRYASMPKARDELVVIDSDEEAPLGWVIAVLDCLNELGFKSIRFKGWEPKYPVPPK